MAVRREHKPGDLDKRLKILNQQLYGKDKSVAPGGQEQKVSTKTLMTNYQLPATNSSDILYLRKDLLKITILAGLAFATQFGLYFGSIHHLIKLPF